LTVDLLDPAFLWIAARFTPEAYMVSTKVQGLVWSLADLLLVFVFLRIADTLREGQGAPPIRWRYALLAATALATPLLLFAASSRAILLLESLICGVQFLILVATLVLERARFLGLARRLGRRNDRG
jgi:hypothetical protein